jgi:hypothetical protein
VKEKEVEKKSWRKFCLFIIRYRRYLYIYLIIKRQNFRLFFFPAHSWVWPSQSGPIANSLASPLLTSLRTDALPACLPPARPHGAPRLACSSPAPAAQDLGAGQRRTGGGGGGGGPSAPPPARLHLPSAPLPMQLLSAPPTPLHLPSALLLLPSAPPPAPLLLSTRVASSQGCVADATYWGQPSPLWYYAEKLPPWP